ncbi:MAG: metal ABC transporter substrate-binding protein [Selenomonas sp.]|nr:metal ABC transporter substrate-binding protein [Selenomonadales bacterium]MDD7762426.1 metal ABC transporter substrate-binding protein [Selenomonadales bacterium]MDY5716159.1 metal ABC transporter substrate-binding protein [Selenomonas sp.]
MKKLISLLLLVIMCFMALGCDSKQAEKKDFTIVTSFYPMYIDVINITKDVEGVKVINMTKPQTGCLHDYQLTTEDMKTLEQADVFVANGAGMESFLDKATKQNKNMKVVEASNYKDINFIKDGDEDNPHVWMSVTYSIAQVKAITAALCEADPAHKDAYRKNALDYCMKLEKLKKEMHEELDDLPHRDIVTFHEAFPYLAKEFKLNIVSVIEREPGTEPTPQELETTIAKVNTLPVKVLFTEPQYSPAAAETIAKETGAKIYQLDPVVTGEANLEAMDAYISAMKKNMNILKEALQ